MLGIARLSVFATPPRRMMMMMMARGPRALPSTPTSASASPSPATPTSSVEPLWLRKAREQQQQQQQQQQHKLVRLKRRPRQKRAEPAITPDEAEDEDEDEKAGVTTAAQVSLGMRREVKARWKRDARGQQLGHMALEDIVDLLRREGGRQLWVMDMRARTSVWVQHMIIVEGASTRHLGAMADLLVEELKGRKIPEINNEPVVEGRLAKDWMLVETGNTVVQFMLPQARAFYNLESLWTNMDLDEWIPGEQPFKNTLTSPVPLETPAAPTPQTRKADHILVGRPPKLPKPKGRGPRPVEALVISNDRELTKSK